MQGYWIVTKNGVHRDGDGMAPVRQAQAEYAGQPAAVQPRVGRAANRPCRAAAWNTASASPCQLVQPLPAAWKTPANSGFQPSAASRSAIARMAAARSCVAVGQPIWSATTRSRSVLRAAFSMVSTKLRPVAPYTQDVRNTIARGQAASTARSPASLVAP